MVSPARFRRDGASSREEESVELAVGEHGYRDPETSRAAEHEAHLDPRAPPEMLGAALDHDVVPAGDEVDRGSRRDGDLRCGLHPGEACSRDGPMDIRAIGPRDRDCHQGVAPGAAIRQREVEDSRARADRLGDAAPGDHE
jgi:hypothetical protein